MFILTTFEDLVQIPPHALIDNKITRQDLEDRINEKYCNKVVQKVGFCLCMYDLLKTSDGLIGHGTGNVNVNVQFRMLVFRPFKGEIITGIINKCTPLGIHIHTHFFEDIFVPKEMLFDDCTYDEDDEGLKTWIWRPNASAEPDDSNEAEAGAVESSACYFDLGLIVNFRVEKENWNDQAPAPPKVRKPGEPEPEQVVEHKVSYSIEASMGEPGLGGVTWW